MSPLKLFLFYMSTSGLLFMQLSMLIWPHWPHPLSSLLSSHCDMCCLNSLSCYFSLLLFNLLYAYVLDPQLDCILFEWDGSTPLLLAGKGKTTHLGAIHPGFTHLWVLCPSASNWHLRLHGHLQWSIRGYKRNAVKEISTWFILKKPLDITVILNIDFYENNDNCLGSFFKKVKTLLVIDTISFSQSKCLAILRSQKQCLTL